jgi:hypothetical protein
MSLPDFVHWCFTVDNRFTDETIADPAWDIDIPEYQILSKIAGYYRRYRISQIDALFPKTHFLAYFPYFEK